MPLFCFSIFPFNFVGTLTVSAQLRLRFRRQNEKKPATLKSSGPEFGEGPEQAGQHRNEPRSRELRSGSANSDNG